MTEHDETLARVVQALKEPVTIDPRLDQRVMAAVEQLPVPGAGRDRTQPRYWTIRLTPMRGLATAAALATMLLAVNLVTRSRELPTRSIADGAAVARQPLQFVLVAPNAQSVALVGDFNDWSLSATRLARQPGDGVWWVTVALPPGRYRYAFIVDGTSWRNDPNAPAAEDEFGRPNSVVTIGGA